MREEVALKINLPESRVQVNRMALSFFSYSMNHDAERNSPHLIFNDRQMSSVSHFFFFSSSHGSAPEPLSLLLYMNIHIRTALWPGSIDSDHPSFSLSKRTPITVSVESESLSGTFKYFNGNSTKCNQFTQYIGGGRLDQILYQG